MKSLHSSTCDPIRISPSKPKALVRPTIRRFLKVKKNLKIRMKKKLTIRFMNRKEKVKVLMSVATSASRLLIEVREAIRKKRVALG